MNEIGILKAQFNSIVTIFAIYIDFLELKNSVPVFMIFNNIYIKIFSSIFFGSSYI
jgi:hypothetical protein